MLVSFRFAIAGTHSILAKVGEIRQEQLVGLENFREVCRTEWVNSEVAAAGLRAESTPEAQTLISAVSTPSALDAVPVG